MYFIRIISIAILGGFAALVQAQQDSIYLGIDSTIFELSTITVNDQQNRVAAVRTLRGIEDFGIYKSKKSEVINLDGIAANLATNNPRQIYSRVTGLNIWESDGAGLQLGIGGRGLSPNRTANFNTRQNGYDISADALGYPESYYTPPAEALDRIELVRGAGSLQYGTQFGGMLNFRYKTGPTDRKIQLTSRQTIGSWGFLGSFNSIGGTVAKGKVNYYGYYQYKTGDGWRENSGFDYHCRFGSVRYQATQKLTLQAEVTSMDYLAQQPGGLTDRMFEENARQSVRARNWFNVNWNVGALLATYRFNDRTQLNVRTFGLLAGRESLGNLERIHVADFGDERTLIQGKFQNIGQEGRLLHRWNAFGLPQTLLVGYRVYRGKTISRQGDGPEGEGADFQFGNMDSDYVFSNDNQALFAEQVFNLTEKWSITPGVRVEHIGTGSEGYYVRRVFDAAGNEVVRNQIDDDQFRNRAFVLGGIGSSWQASPDAELYTNFSQNYRAINFSDLRIINPNLVVDSTIMDERGFTMDLGFRGSKNGFRYDLTAFYIAYRDKIGQVLRADLPPLFNDYRLRTNVADARNIGIEAFGEYDLLERFDLETTDQSLTIFGNVSVVDARYINSDDSSFRDKRVELAPPFMGRTGITYQRNDFRAGIQYNYTASHFSDATNAERTTSAIEGRIPAYQIVDLSLSYRWNVLRFEATVNNLLNETYFTRRADAYPGPGIISAEGRGFFMTVGVVW